VNTLPKYKIDSEGYQNAYSQSVKGFKIGEHIAKKGNYIQISKVQKNQSSFWQDFIVKIDKMLIIHLQSSQECWIKGNLFIPSKLQVTLSSMKVL